MEGVESSVDKRKSFGFSLGDERIKLIDILAEDDDCFLVASPFCDSLQDCFSGEQGGFRLSGFGNSLEVPELPRRPSFMRRSLAWDSAFLNSAGVLDPDELSLINKGFGTTEARPLPPGTQGGRKQRSDVDSSPNASLDWFEFELFEKRRTSAYKSKPGKVFDDLAHGNLEPGLTKEGKIKYNETCTRKSMYLQSRMMMKKETTGGNGKHAISSPKPPKASGRSVKRKDLPGKSNVKMGNRSAITGSGKSLVIEKKSFCQRSPNSSIISLTTSNVSGSLCKTPQASSSTLKRRTELRKSKLSTPVSTWRDSDRPNVKGSQSFPTYSPSLLNHQSPASCSAYFSSRSFFSSSLSCKKQRSNLESKIPSPLVLTNENSGLRSAKQYSSCAASETRIVSLSTDNFRPSALRQPSLTIGFFNEKHSSSHEAISRKMPNKVSSDGKKTQHENSEMPRKSDAKRPRNKLVAMNSSFEEEKRRGSLNNKRCKGNSSEENAKKRSLYSSVDQIGNLSRYFERIALDQPKPVKQKVSDWEKSKTGNQLLLNSKPGCTLFSPQLESVPSMRTPLADKSSLSNFSQAFPLPLEQKKEKMSN